MVKIGKYTIIVTLKSGKEKYYYADSIYEQPSSLKFVHSKRAGSILINNEPVVWNNHKKEGYINKRNIVSLVVKSDME